MNALPCSTGLALDAPAILAVTHSYNNVKDAVFVEKNSSISHGYHNISSKHMVIIQYKFILLSNYTLLFVKVQF